MKKNKNNFIVYAFIRSTFKDDGLEREKNGTERLQSEV